MLSTINSKEKLMYNIMLCMKEMRAYSICQYLGHQEVDNKKEIFCFNPSLDLGLGSEKKKKYSVLTSKERWKTYMKKIYV